MTCQEFNKKYKDYLEENNYGLDIGDLPIVNYLDGIFKELIKIPGFQYSQIKSKFGLTRFYSNLGDVMGKIGYIIEAEIEKQLNFLLKVEEEIYKRKKNEG
jgi:hypothetical protein